MMITMSRDFSLSMQTTLDFQPCLDLLKQSLSREGFHVVAEVPFHTELVRHTGLRWQNYTVLVIWSPFHAYQALLSDRDAGIFMPFHFVVAEDGRFTLVAATNHALYGRIAGTLGLQVLARELVHKIRQIFSELSSHEESAVNLTMQAARKEAS